MEYERLFAQFDALQERAGVNAVFGPPVETGGKIVIPAASVSYAFGLGLGEGQGPSSEDSPGGSGGGGGGGARSRPVAVIEITPERTHVEGVVDEQLIALAGLAFAAWAVFWVASALIRIFGRDRS